MQRPSHLYARAEKHGEKITNVRVGGQAEEVAQVNTLSESVDRSDIAVYAERKADHKADLYAD